jgi:plastocyanin
MKKILPLIMLLIMAFEAMATIHVVTVANFQFSPALVSANVGDTVRWVWSSGFHTTTSTSVPAGANTWNANISSGSTSFEYVLNVQGTYEYWCVPHAPGMSGTLEVGGVLPVKFGELLISASRNKKPILTWQAFSEENIQYYRIMRSTDLSHYAEAGRVAGKGQASTSVRYSFTDEGFAGSDRYLYYYLEAVHIDGGRALSAVRMFRNETGNQQLISRISPNPAPGSGHVTVQFNADKPGKARVKIIQTGGQVVMETDLQAMTGLNNGHLHLGHHHPMPSGKYTLVISLEGRSETVVLVVL